MESKKKQKNKDKEKDKEKKKSNEEEKDKKKSNEEEKEPEQECEVVDWYAKVLHKYDFDKTKMKIKAELLHEVDAHEMPIVACEYISVTDQIATGGDDNLIKIWTEKEDRSDPGSTYLKCTHTLDAHTGKIYTLKEYPEEQLLLSCSYDFTAKLYNVRNNFQIVANLNSHKAPLYQVNYSAKISRIGTAGHDKLIKIWSPKGKELFSFEAHEMPIISIHFIDELNLLCSVGTDSYIKFWDYANKFTLVKMFSNLESNIECTIYCDNRLLIAYDSIVNFVNIKKFQRLISVQFSNFPVSAILITKKRTFLFHGSKDGKIRIWKIGTDYRYLIDAHEKEVTGMLLFKKNILVSVSSDKTMKVWKLKNFVDE